MAASIGAILAEPRSAAQNSVLAGWTLYYNHGFYIGLYIDSSGTWRYFSDNSPVTYFNWSPGQPVGPSGVMEVEPHGGGGGWNDLAPGNATFGAYQWEPSSYYSNFDEYFQDYHSTWTSIPTDVYDQRITLQYQWVSNAHDIYGKRERFETVPVDVTVVGEKTVTQWGTEAISEAQTTLVTARIPDTTLVQAGTFQAARHAVSRSHGAARWRTCDSARSLHIEQWQRSSGLRRKHAHRRTSAGWHPAQQHRRCHR
jgi:hypothetical protein